MIHSELCFYTQNQVCWFSAVQKNKNVANVSICLQCLHGITENFAFIIVQVSRKGCFAKLFRKRKRIVNQIRRDVNAVRFLKSVCSTHHCCVIVRNGSTSFRAVLLYANSGLLARLWLPKCFENRLDTVISSTIIDSCC